ncbi:DNA circularization protein [Burkholderia stagnalis]|uniref:DNA circularization protein n=1 Tax=Burkholderia stagnalis TaxID=1503054 RepID=UPI0007C6FEFA|nr:DNA circularization N-terminal domain-containing protein [Burkholderia stagnalis]
MSISTRINSVTGSILSASSALSSLATTLSGGSWQEALRTASFGGVPFAVEALRTSGGRRVSVHSYPFRDEVWVEDIGKLARKFDVRGFLVENSLIYGGGGVAGQRKRLLAVAETAGGQTLVHPTLGTVTNVVCISPIEFVERADLGRVFEFSMTLVKGGARIYPNASMSTVDAVTSSALGLALAALADFASTVADAITLGTSIVNQAIATVTKWVGIVNSVIADVKRLTGAVSSLSGSYGRYAGGGNRGYVRSNAAASSAATVASLLSQSVTARQAVATAGIALTAAASSVSDTASFAGAASSVASAVAASASDPADAMRMLSAMAEFSPNDPTTSSVIGDAMATMQTACGALLRRTAIAELATVSTTYQPSSSDDAVAVRDQIASLIDAETTTAGDAGDDASYDALRTLRQSVVSDFAARGAKLASTQAYTFGSGLPSLVLANRLYRDPSRADELVSQADPIHPAFMPTSFSALSS